jgi:hypothetical protein
MILLNGILSLILGFIAGHLLEKSIEERNWQAFWIGLVVCLIAIVIIL